MQLVNFHYFYPLSKSLQQLNHLRSGQPIFDSFLPLYQAEMAIRGFLSNDVVPAEASRESCEALLAALDKLTTNPGRPEPLEPEEVSNIQDLLKAFEHVLEGEYRIKIIFALSNKGLYSLSHLAFRGHEMVPAEVHKLMPDIVLDLREAGRCVAFEVPTAAAFHLFRATEAAAKSYICAIRGTPVTSHEKNLGLGGYAKILAALGVDLRVTSAIEQLVKLHRNPTVHPDVHVTNDEVLATMGMTESVIRTMAIDMTRRNQHPNVSLDEFLPEKAEAELAAGADQEPAPSSNVQVAKTQEGTP